MYLLHILFLYKHDRPVDLSRKEKYKVPKPLLPLDKARMSERRKFQSEFTRCGDLVLAKSTSRSPSRGHLLCESDIVY